MTKIEELAFKILDLLYKNKKLVIKELNKNILYLNDPKMNFFIKIERFKNDFKRKKKIK